MNTLKETADLADSVQQVFTNYRPIAGVYDEAASKTGARRESWEPFYQHLSGLSSQELDRRLAQAQRQLDMDGVAFNPHDADGDVSRPWMIDPIPLIIRQMEWDALSAGLEQRAQVADLILLDLLGPQTLLHEKILPPEILFACPKYSPAYHSLVPRPKQHLQFYAADLARSPDGKWWVTGDRARNPFGLGYILENRLASSRLLPGAFRSCNVMRLAPFFITLRRTLKDLAQRQPDNPRVAIWTKGPQSRSYFEDAFLARYLGYTLVEGGDLAVRGNRVMLKTLGGLLPVEVLFKRIEDHNCDPAELVSDGAYGVSGILEVIRSGQVTVANSIGSALIESPMLHAFMPSVCEHLLGEELILPSVATWWCGERDAREHVLKNLDDLLIRKAFRSEKEDLFHPSLMNAEQRQKLIEEIGRKPEMFVGQERVQRSTTPVWHEGELQPWSLALRAFLVAKEGSYQTLPGALARVSTDPNVFAHNMTSGEKSQDVWIVADEPVPRVSLLTEAGKQVELKRGGAELPSRVADNLFWLGRNLERAEQLARLVRITLLQLASEEASVEQVRGLLGVCREAKQLSESVASDANPQDVSNSIAERALAPSVPDSLHSAIKSCYRTTSKVRDRIALDSSRVITELNEIFHAAFLNNRSAQDLLPLLDAAITSLNAASGFAGESMTRGLAWRFLDLGRRIERAYQTANVLRCLFDVENGEAEHVANLENCLQICDSFMTYRGRYLSDIQSEAVLDLLVTDASNPRSLGFQTERIIEHIEMLPRKKNQAALSAEQRIAISMHNSVRLANVNELCIADSSGERSALARWLTKLMEQLPRLADTISGRFLIHAGLQRHLASNRVEKPLQQEQQE